MPNYDFKCTDCGETFQRQVSIAEKSSVICPECHSTKLQQVYGQFGIQIKNKNKPSAGCQGCPSMGSCRH